MTVYRIKFTRDFIDSRSVNVPADTLADAYIKVQKEFPNCMIIGAKIAETKVKPVKDGAKWAQAIAKCLIDNATIDDACELASYLDEEQQEELVDAIWKVYHSGNKKEDA